MSEKKPWWKIGIGATIAGILGVGIEEGIRQNTEDDEVVNVSENIEKKSENEPAKEAAEDLSDENKKRADEQRQKDLEQTRNVKKFISKIYEEEPFVEITEENITERHAKLKENLERKIGDKYEIGEVRFITDSDGKREYYFHVVTKNADGNPGETVEVDYEDDGTVSVEDEGVNSFINIKTDEKMIDNMVGQMDKAIRMRLEERRYKFDQFYSPDKYKEFLRNEGYDEAQIDYIMRVKGKSVEDAIRGVDNK